MLDQRNFKMARFIGTGALAVGLCVPAALFQSVAFAQDRDRDERDHGRDRDRIARIEPGTKIDVRTDDKIDVERRDDRVYRGTVDKDVRGENGRLAIPRGSRVELKVRVAPDNDLILDLESVNVNGQRYAVKADADRVEAQHDNSLVGAIVGAVTGVEVRGHVVKVPRDTVLTFRIDRPMALEGFVPDPGVSLYARLLRHDSR
jgi:hypothetical protein